LQALSGPQNDLLRKSSTLQVAYGARIMSSSSGVLSSGQDISTYMTTGSSVTSDVGADVHRSAVLTFDSDVLDTFDYLADFCQPYMTVSNPSTGQTLTVNLGVYVLQTPPIDLSALPSKISFQGYDLLTLLNVPVGDSYEVPVGVDPAGEAINAIQAALPWASVQGTTSGVLTTQVFSFPFDQSNNFTWLDIVNTLLAAAGYLPVWVDWNGVFQVGTRAIPSVANFVPEAVFDLSDEFNMLQEGRQVIQDLYDVPNKWIFVMQNLQDAPVEGSTMYTVIDNSSSPTSVTSRGRTVSKIVSVATATADITSYPQLVQAGQQVVLSDLAPTETYTFTSALFPVLWHYDFVRIQDPNLVVARPLKSPARIGVVSQWTLPLDGSGDQAVTFQTLPNYEA
jgi:hypothetical protein